MILPSLDEVKDAVSMAKSWLSRSQPFLSRDSLALGSSPSLEIDTLKVNHLQTLPLWNMAKLLHPLL